VSNPDPNAATPPTPAPPDSLAGLRWRIDTALSEAADRAATAAGGRILAAARVPREVGVTWTYNGDGHLRGMAEAGTPRAELEHLCAAIAHLTGGAVTHHDEVPATIDATGWLPANEATPPHPRLHVRVWGVVFRQQARFIA
jgi:hypothetical protein